MLEIWAKHRKTEFGLRNARKAFRKPVMQCSAGAVNANFYSHRMLPTALNPF